MAEVSENRREGLIDKSGKRIVAPQYLYTLNFSGKETVAGDDLSQDGKTVWKSDNTIGLRTDWKLIRKALNWK